MKIVKDKVTGRKSKTSNSEAAALVDLLDTHTYSTKGAWKSQENTDRKINNPAKIYLRKKKQHELTKSNR